MKVIFLDIDGVLNHAPGRFSLEYLIWKWFKWQWEVPYQIERKLAKRVEHIIKKTGAKVVISSTWRLHYPKASQWNRLFSVLQLKTLRKSVIDVTPRIPEHIRGEEINTWLELNGDNVTDYVILDDDRDMTPKQLEKHFVHTSFYKGLTWKGARMAVRILNRGNGNE